MRRLPLISSWLESPRSTQCADRRRHPAGIEAALTCAAPPALSHRHRHLLVSSLLTFSSLLPAAALEQRAMVVPNEHGQPAGSTLALEGGAGAARSYEAGSAWYNPATAAGLDGESLSVSASAYELSQVKLESANAGTSSSLGANSVKGYAGSASRWPSWEDNPPADAPMTAFIVTTPRSWRAAVDQRQEELAGSNLKTVGSSVSVNLATYAGEFAVAWNLPHGLAVGVGGIGLLDNLTYSNTNYARQVTATQVQTADVATQVSSSELSLQGIAGISWRGGDGYALGLSLRTPSGRIWNQGNASYSGSVTDTVNGQIVLVDGRTDDAARTIHPFEATVGIARTIGQLTCEIDAIWSAPSGSIDSVSAIPVRTVVSSGGTNTISTGGRPAQTTTYRSVVNLAAGLAVPLSPDLTLHLGGFTDRSPVQESTFYDTVDFYGASAGLSIRLSRTILHLGATVVSSETQKIIVLDALTGAPVEASLRVLRVDGLIGVTHLF